MTNYESNLEHFEIISLFQNFPYHSESFSLEHAELNLSKNWHDLIMKNDLDYRLHEIHPNQIEMLWFSSKPYILVWFEFDLDQIL